MDGVGRLAKPVAILYFISYLATLPMGESAYKHAVSILAVLICYLKQNNVVFRSVFINQYLPKFNLNGH
jgi:hypothetical protein